MGEAIADPPQSEAAPAAPGASSADDLLAQMAGDEIDRLLAEAENGTPSPAAPAALPPEVPVVAETPVAEAATAPPAPEAIAETPAPAPVASEALKTEAPTETPRATDAPTAIENASNDAANQQADPAPSPAPAAPETPAPALIVESHSDDDDESLPAYLKFLDVLISPMAVIPDAVRSAMGKVAVITLLNAVGLIVYVTFFRHHRGH